MGDLNELMTADIKGILLKKGYAPYALNNTPLQQFVR